MTPELERFLDIATRPLEAVPGDRDEAKGELMSRVGHAGMPLDMLDLSEPIQRLDRTKAPNPVARRIALLGSLIVLIGGAGTLIAHQVRDGVRMVQAAMLSRMARNPGISDHDGSATSWLLPHVREVAPELPLGLAEGRYEAGSEETEACLERQPDDLPMLQEHLSRKIFRDLAWNGMTPEEQATISRLDPDNALWPLIQVTPFMRRATGSRSPMFYMASGGSVASEPDMAGALRCFSEAAAKGRYQDHSLALRRRQVEAFPRARSIAEDEIANRHAELVTPVFSYYSRGLSVMADLHCQRLTTATDTEGLRKFFSDWKQVARLILTGGVDRHDELAVYELTSMASHFSKAFDRLGMPVEKAEVMRFEKVITGGNHSMVSAPTEIERWGGPRIHGSQPIPHDLKPEEMIPARRTELAFFDRAVATVFSVLAIFFAGLVGLEACRRTRRVKGLARGLMPLFRNSDHAWIGGLGLAFPWLWWWVITRLTPLELRNVKMEEWEVTGLILQLLAGLVFGLVMLLQTARWRWGIRGGFLGLGASLSWFAWVVAGLTALAIPAAGMIRHLGLNQEESAMFLLGVAGMIACGLLWLLWEGVMNLFTPKASSLRPNLTMRVLLPWTLAGVLTLLIAAGVSTAMERYWFAKDPLLPNWTSKTHMNALEERAAAGFREAMRGL